MNCGYPEDHSTTACTPPVESLERNSIQPIVRIGTDEEETISKRVARTVEPYLRLKWPQEAEDVLQETVLDVLMAFRGSRIRDLNALESYARTVARRKVAARIRAKQTGHELHGGAEVIDTRPATDAQLIREQEVQLMHSVLKEMDRRSQEILIRFYLHGQGREQIQREMCLTQTSYRLLKSRAKAKLVERVQKRVRLRDIPSFTVPAPKARKPNGIAGGRQMSRAQSA